MEFFKNKTNIILTLVLCIVLGAAGFLTYNYLFAQSKTLVPDFSDKTIDDVNTWCKSLETNPCSIEYDYSSTIEKDYVIYQSISEDNELTDSISFIVSLGNEETITLPDLNDISKDDLDIFFFNNNITNITYTYESSDTVEKGDVIKVEPSTDITKDSTITVYVSSGEDNDNTISVVANTYTNITVKQFENKMAELGLSPEHASSRDEYSSTVTEGNIIWHGSGDYIKDEVIHYGVSLGSDSDAIKVEKGTYVGKTLEEFSAAVKKLGEDGLVPTHDEDWDEYSSTVTKGNIVVHGSGTYEDGEIIHYGLSLGPKDDEIVITTGQYIGKTYAEFETAVKALGLGTAHRTDWDEETSDSSKAGNICFNGYGTYEKGENCSYGLYVMDEDITITSGQYVGKSYSDFETAVKALGLTTKHNSDWDEKTSDSSEVGKVCKNGSGTYVSGEACSYGLYIADSSSTSTTITITKNQYVGYSESDYKAAITALGLNPSHYSDWDEYSDSVEKGKIIFNGYGTYTKGETSRYGLSLGKKETTETTVTTVSIESGIYNNKTASEIESAITSLGLVAYHNTSKDAYSSVTKDNVVYHDYGTFNMGATVNYGLSLGVQTLYIGTVSFYNTNNLCDTYDAMVSKMKTVLSGFSNITYVKTESYDVAVGKISYIEINGSTSYDPGYIASNTPIEIGIVNSLKAS